MLQPTTCNKQHQQRQQPAMAAMAAGDSGSQDQRITAKDHGALEAETESETATATATATAIYRKSSNFWCQSNMLPVSCTTTRCSRSCSSNSSSTTIDFNSRRRRGRLRGHAPLALEERPEQHQATLLDECVNIFKRLVLLTLKTISATTITKAKTRSRAATEAEAAASATSRGASGELSGSPTRSRCHLRCLRLPIYSLLLVCLATQGLGLGDAAKPKSAKQHFGGSSNNNNPNQNQNQNDVLPQASNEALDEAELLYPYQSGEQMFGLEEDQDQEQLGSNAGPGSDEDNAANQRGINGEYYRILSASPSPSPSPGHMWNFSLACGSLTNGIRI